MSERDRFGLVSEGARRARAATDAASGTVAPRCLAVGSPLGIVDRRVPRAQTSGRRRILLWCGAAPLKKRRSAHNFKLSHCPCISQMPLAERNQPLSAGQEMNESSGPSPGPYPLLTIPVLPSLSVLVGWCRLAGLMFTVPLSLVGCLEGYLTTELLPTAPLLWQPGGSSTPGSVRVFLWLRRSEDRMLRTSDTWQPSRRLWLAASAGVWLATFRSGDRVACCIPGGWRRLAAVLVRDDTGSTDD